MGRIYTEIRLTHKTLEDKEKFERNFEKALRKHGYFNRAEFIQDKINELVGDSNED